MKSTMEPSSLLSYLRSIRVDKHIINAKRGSEGNVKSKIIVPFLQTLGWDLLGDMDFESMGADIVLFSSNKPGIIVEVKSWGEEITDHLDQCLEYTFKLNTPWVIITSGQDTALYCSLINPEDLLATEPLFRFCFSDLLGDDGQKLLKTLTSLVGKECFIEGHHELSAMVVEHLGDREIAEAQRDFEERTSNYESEIKSKRLTVEEFFSLAQGHPDDVCAALIDMYERIVDIAVLDNNVRVRYRSKEIGLEYSLKKHPRSKIIGLFGIYPGDAHIAFGLENWKELNISESTFKKLNSFPRKVESGHWAESLSDLLRSAIKEIN